MNTTQYKRWLQNRHPRRKHFLTALLVAVMVMISTVPAFAAETTTDASVPDTEVSASAPNLVEDPGDEDGRFPGKADGSEPTSAPITGPVSTIEGLLEAIAHANANDVIEFDGYIQTSSSELVLGRADCPITIRRATSEAHIYLWDRGEGNGNTKVQNITFDGAGIQAEYPILIIEGPMKIVENCNFVNCIALGGSALQVVGDTLISDCHFANNTGHMGAHLRVDSCNATIENCTFTGGFASDTGSVYIDNSEKVFLTGCTILGNAAGKRSGGIYMGKGELIISGCKIHGNTANGIADDITKSYKGLLSLADDYTVLLKLYKPDGVIPNKWTVDSYFDLSRGTAPDCADMIFSMTFADDVAPSPAPEPEILTVTFNANGGTVSPDSVTTNKGSTIVLPTPEREGYTFAGWFMEDGIPVTTNTVFTEDMEIYAQWTEKELEPDPKPEPLPTSITLDKSELTLDIGETAALTATLHPEGRSNGIQWTSGDPSVASVTEDGLITAHSAGTTSITATTPDGEASASCRVNVQAAPVTTYSIDISASPVEGGVVSGNGQYEEGTTVTITAVPNEDFRFLAWIEADTQISTESSLTFTVSNDRTLTAIFEPISEPVPGPIPKPTYTISTSATVGGTVSGAGQYELGSSVTLTATPENRYLFIGWTENDEQISTDESLTFIADRDRTLIANFAPIIQPTYAINVSATAGGTASGGGEYEQGSSVTLTAIPENEYLFVGWTENSEQVSTDESFTFTADRDRTLVANFAPIPTPRYTIQVHSTKGGDAEGGGSYEEGETVTVNAVPDAGYYFLHWEENGVQVSTDENFTFIADHDRTLVASFTLIPKPTYTIQANSTHGGIAEGSGSYEEGEFVTVNAVPDYNYRFLHWEENNRQVCTEAQYSFTAEEDRTLVAVFDLIPQSASDSPYVPSHSLGISSTSRGPQPIATSMSSLKEVQTPTLIGGKATLIAPDDSFWRGYKTGRDNGSRIVTRADLAQLVYSMMDDTSRKIYGVTRSPFRDVEPGAWYEAAAGTMLNTGIMFGCGDGLFCPNRTLTWGELLTVFARFTEDRPLTEYYVGEHWAKDAVNKAFTLGWLEYSEAFDPGKPVTTSEMVSLIQAIFQWNSK